MRLARLGLYGEKQILEESVRQCRRDLEQALAEVRGSQRVLVQSQRLSAIGTMASGVAHDFKNALMLIMGSGEILLHDAEHQRLTNENAIPLLQEILAAARDASTLVGQLRGFSRSGDLTLDGEKRGEMALYGAITEQFVRPPTVGPVPLLVRGGKGAINVPH